MADGPQVQVWRNEQGQAPVLIINNADTDVTGESIRFAAWVLPHASYAFDDIRLSGYEETDVIENAGAYSIVMNGEKELTAHFVPGPFVDLFDGPTGLSDHWNSQVNGFGTQRQLLACSTMAEANTLTADWPVDDVEMSLWYSVRDWLDIPSDSGHPFRLITLTDSERIRPPIPIDSGH